jgi:hypothetical protein
MSCNGNKAEICGGGNRLDLYSYLTCNSTTSGWSFKGCYNDSVSARTLTHGPVVVGPAGTQMTIELCQKACDSLGYNYAGVEYAVECCMYPFLSLCVC